MKNTQRKRESNPKPHPHCGDCDGRDARLHLPWQPHCREINAALGYPDGSDTLAAFATALTLEALGQGRRISYSRRKDHYALPHRYRDPLYTYRRVVGAADRLVAEGLVDHFKVAPGNLGWQSAIRARPELVRLVGPIIDRGFELRRPPEPIVLRDCNGHPMDYRDDRQTRRMRRAVEAQNEAIAGVGGPHITPLRRIFSGDFEHGGRFYAAGGGWQMLSKKDRAKIRIAGERVVELDYAQFHPSLAYGIAGHTLPPDAYDIPGFSRDAGKVAFNVMLNSTGRHGARWTLAHEHPELLGCPLHGEGAFQEALAAADHLLDALLAKHDAIRDMFFVQSGLILQKVDSNIAGEVMAEMLRRGVVLLPIHDSFLCPASKAAELEAVMVEKGAEFGLYVKNTTFADSPGS